MADLLFSVSTDGGASILCFHQWQISSFLYPPMADLLFSVSTNGGACLLFIHQWQSFSHLDEENKDDPLVVAVVDHLLSRLFKKGGRKLIIILDYTDFLPVPCRKKWDFYNQYNADLDPWIRIYIIKVGS